jgi:carbamoyltransferase
VTDHLVDHEWEGLRSLFVQRAPLFLKTALPGLDPGVVRFVPHHVAHAASAYLASPFPSSAVMVCDGRGERGSYLGGHAVHGDLEILATVSLPHSLGLMYEEATEHLGFRRSSDEYKVMALAAYGRPVHLDAFRDAVRLTSDGGFTTSPVDWERFSPRRTHEGEWGEADADLAASLQAVLEERLLDVAHWLHARTGERALVAAGGVALNCVANSRILRDGPFDEMWVQPAAGDAGTALGAAVYIAHSLGDRVQPMQSAALGREWTDAAIQAALSTANVAFTRVPDVAEDVAGALTSDAVVAWVQGRSEYGPRALGHRSLLANPTRAANLERLNDIKGREQFRPVAPMVLAERAHEIFDGPLPSPYMLFTHQVRPGWRDRIPAVVHVDGSARVQTVHREQQPLMARVLEAFERRTGVPVLVNTSLNTGGRPMVDSPRDALECFGSSPVDVMAIGPYVLRRARTRATSTEAA